MAKANKVNDISNLGTDTHSVLVSLGKTILPNRYKPAKTKMAIHIAIKVVLLNKCHPYA